MPTYRLLTQAYRQVLAFIHIEADSPEAAQDKLFEQIAGDKRDDLPWEIDEDGSIIQAMIDADVEELTEDGKTKEWHHLEERYDY